MIPMNHIYSPQKLRDASDSIKLKILGVIIIIAIIKFNVKLPLPSFITIEKYKSFKSTSEYDHLENLFDNFVVQRKSYINAAYECKTFCIP
jgi:hypothetical protein